MLTRVVICERSDFRTCDAICCLMVVKQGIQEKFLENYSVAFS